MTKPEMVAEIAKQSGVTKKDAERIFNASIDVISTTLKAGDRVQIAGFGTFEVKTRQARVGINPRTKEKIEIPAQRIPTFKAGKTLKDLVK